MAFVVLQHLSPDFKSLMDELLARRTTMRVRQAEVNLPLEPNTVYLLPPMKEMIIRQRTLLLNDKDPRHGLTLPIDLFFRSLAQDVGARGIAVVLSGSGSDGSRGIHDVSRAGGIVLCESPDTAQFNGMPLSAIRTGVVDHVQAPEELAATIAAVARPKAEAAVEYSAGDEDRGVDAVLRLLRDEYGIDFSHYKASTVSRRIERRLALNRSLDIEMYIEQLRSDSRELNLLYEDLLIGVTRFFRDDAAFDTLEHRIIPELVERTAPDDQIRVWVPGCATGQEAYSVAILLYERLAARNRPFNVKILATDFHKVSLEVASTGVYSEEQLAGVSHDRLQRFFTPRSNGFQVSQALRDAIVFASHNLIRDAPFTKLDLITCRNLLIYFQPHAQKTVLALFHFALKAGGFLFLGSSESPGGLVDEFDNIDEHAKIYRKRRDIGLPRDLKLPLPRSSAAARIAVPSVARPGGTVNQQQLTVHDKLLDRFMPPSFLVDEHGMLVDTFGGAESFLRIKARRPSQSLLDMLDDELRPVMGGLLHRVRRDVEAVRYPAVPMPGKNSRFSLVAEPIRDAHGVLLNILVSLADSGTIPAPALVPPFADVPAPTGIDSHRLQPEVAGLSRDHLQALEDELSYTKEHLLNGTDVATMFLDRQLCIRKFTPRIAETFRVIPQDVGRPIRTFTHDLQYPSLLADVEAVLRDGGIVESQTFDKRGRCFFLRILPYRARIREQVDAPVVSAPAPDASHAPDGVVITLTDISPLEQARARLAQLSAIVESSDDAIIGKTLDGIINTWNGGAERLYGYAAGEALGRHASFLYPPGRKDEIETVIDRVRSGGVVERLQTKRQRKDGTLVDVSVTYSPILSGDAVVGVSAISRDISQFPRAAGSGRS